MDGEVCHFIKRKGSPQNIKVDARVCDADQRNFICQIVLPESTQTSSNIKTSTLSEYAMSPKTTDKEQFTPSSTLSSSSNRIEITFAYPSTNYLVIGTVTVEPMSSISASETSNTQTKASSLSSILSTQVWDITSTVSSIVDKSIETTQISTSKSIFISKSSTDLSGKITSSLETFSTFLEETQISHANVETSLQTKEQSKIGNENLISTELESYSSEIILLSTKEGFNQRSTHIWEKTSSSLSFNIDQKTEIIDASSSTLISPSRSEMTKASSMKFKDATPTLNKFSTTEISQAPDTVVKSLKESSTETNEDWSSAQKVSPSFENIFTSTSGDLVQPTTEFITTSIPSILSESTHEWDKTPTLSSIVDQLTEIIDTRLTSISSSEKKTQASVMETSNESFTETNEKKTSRQQVPTPSSEYILKSISEDLVQPTTELITTSIPSMS